MLARDGNVILPCCYHFFSQIILFTIYPNDSTKDLWEFVVKYMIYVSSYKVILKYLLQVLELPLEFLGKRSPVPSFQTLRGL